MKCRWAPWLAAAVLLLLLPEPAAAYVGPGPGFVLVTSFLAVFVSSAISFLALLTWPFRAAWLFLRRLGRPKPRVRRVVIVGFDGQDPGITERMMDEGRLPYFQRLAEEGSYRRLATTYPSVSPVAWSSFSTGTHPAKHGIYDFLDRDRKSYMPVLSSSKIGGVEKTLKIGRWRIPLERPELRLLRGSKPFWTILGKNWIWSTILRVPVTFPPDRFRGAQLSAMCVPDLLGSQGTFTFFTTRPSDQRYKEGGRRVALKIEREASPILFTAELEGPPNELKVGAPPLSLPLSIQTADGDPTRVTLGKETRELEVGKLSDWIPLAFPAAPGLKVRGICRTMVTELGEHTSLYVTPIHLDPEHPAMPISHPSYYAPYLARKIGTFATLGLAEDTWAMNEGVIDGGTFLKQTYAIDAEREAMLSSSLKTVRRGTVVCVFDATDRIQHMFWRPMEEGPEVPHADAIEKLYEHNDAVLGRVMERLRPEDLLMVLSDHGFSSFRRGINLNAWLEEAGYLTLNEGADGTSEWLREVDWSKTRAYALGLTGIFLNIQGREGEGIVDPVKEAGDLRNEIAERLRGFRDEERGEVAIREAFDPGALASGPYLERAPDLIVGYNRGYRASWDGATGIVAGPVFTDNKKAWSGDHCIDPRLVPGVLFCNRFIREEEPALVDIAPSTLWLFGLKPPDYMDGKVFFEARDFGGKP
jgi:predicted AlkP superfamily phosphohydrolase/phosphomutase